jgi:hypothetical protein
MSASRRNPETSFTIDAPAANASAATLAFTVSIEIGIPGKSAATERMAGITRRRSSPGSTGTAPCGRVDSPPMSMTSAPSAIKRSTRRRTSSSVRS